MTPRAILLVKHLPYTYSCHWFQSQELAILYSLEQQTQNTCYTLTSHNDQVYPRQFLCLGYYCSCLYHKLIDQPITGWTEPQANKCVLRKMCVTCHIFRLANHIKSDRQTEKEIYRQTYVQTDDRVQIRMWHPANWGHTLSSLRGIQILRFLPLPRNLHNHV